MSNEIVTESGLKIKTNVKGSGAIPKKGQTIAVHYVGELTDGRVFDSSFDKTYQPFVTTIGVGQVIKGWDEAFMGMKEGTHATLTIPPELAYGERGGGNIIPPNATLIFDVELLEVIKDD